MKPKLSPRQTEAVALAATGMRHDLIAERMKISRCMVEKHLAAARKKCDASTTTAAVFFLCQSGRVRSTLTTVQLTLAV